VQSGPDRGRMKPHSSFPKSMVISTSSRSVSSPFTPKVCKSSLQPTHPRGPRRVRTGVRGTTLGVRGVQRCRCSALSRSYPFPPTHYPGQVLAEVLMWLTFDPHREPPTPLQVPVKYRSSRTKSGCFCRGLGRR
jgi:hypothetical protein